MNHAAISRAAVLPTSSKWRLHKRSKNLALWIRDFACSTPILLAGRIAVIFHGNRRIIVFHAKNGIKSVRLDSGGRQSVTLGPTSGMYRLACWAGLALRRRG